MSRQFRIKDVINQPENSGSNQLVHPDAVKAPALDDFIINARIPQLFIKTDCFNAAVYPDLFIAELLYPLFGFGNNAAAEVQPAVFRKNNYSADKHRPFIQLIKAAGRDRIFIIQKDDVFASVAVMLVKLITKRDVILTVHPLYPDRIRACALPCFLRSERCNLRGACF